MDLMVITYIGAGMLTCQNKFKPENSTEFDYFEFPI